MIEDHPTFESLLINQREDSPLIIDNPISKIEGTFAGHPDIWEEVLVGLRILNNYSSAVPRDQLSRDVWRTLDIARRVSLGESQQILAQDYPDIHYDEIRRNLARTTMSLRIIFPELVSFEDVNNMYGTRRFTEEREEETRTIYESFIKLRESNVIKGNNHEPHLKSFLELFVEGYSVEDIAKEYKVPIALSKAQRLGRGLINKLVFGKESEIKIASFLDNMVLSQWLRLGENWKGSNIAEKDILNIINESINTQERLGQFGTNLRAFVFIIAQIENNISSVLCRDNMVISFNMSEVSESFGYLLGATVDGIPKNVIASEISKETGVTSYKNSAIRAAIVAGVRGVVSILLGQSIKGDKLDEANKRHNHIDLLLEELAIEVSIS